MSTGYKINGVDIDDIYEVIASETADGVTPSAFMSGKFKVGGEPLQAAIGKVIPTSAGSHIGGSNSTDKFKTNGQPIDVALKGRRPTGIPLATLLAGVHYINRLNGQTWLSTEPNAATGTLLEYNPTCFHIELQGGGGGGAGSASLYCSSGGGAGGYSYCTLEVAEGDSVKIEVGGAGARGEAREYGGAGGQSSIYGTDGVQKVYANGGAGGAIDNGVGGLGGSAGGGIVNVTGAQGGHKRTVGYSLDAFDVVLDTPEQRVITRGGTAGGGTGGDNYGGGGGASAFAAGAAGDSRTTPTQPGINGSGGAGAGYKAAAANAGGAGGEGVVLIYY